MEVNPLDSTLKTKLNAIQSNKAVDTTKYAAVTDPQHNFDPAELNTLIDAVKANNTDAEAAQSTADAANTAATNAQSAVTALFLPLVTGAIPDNAVAPNHKMASNGTQFWVSDGTQWNEVKGGVTTPLSFTLYQLKSTTSDGWTVRFDYTDTGKVVTVEQQLDNGVWTQVSPVWVTDAWEVSVTSQTAAVHAMKLRISDGTNITTTNALTIDLAAPTASGVSISGTPGVGNVLTGNYTYSDVGSSPEGNSTFRWLRNGVAIAGATAKTYTQITADLGQTIVFEVTPVATTGVLTGTPVQSSGLNIPVPQLTGLNVVANNAQNTISWNAGVVGATYNLYWSTTSGVTKSNGTKIPGVSTPYVHSPLTNGLTYYYVVTQVINGVESAESSEVSGRYRTLSRNTTGKLYYYDFESGSISPFTQAAGSVTNVTDGGSKKMELAVSPAGTPGQAKIPDGTWNIPRPAYLSYKYQMLSTTPTVLQTYFGDSVGGANYYLTWGTSATASKLQFKTGSTLLAESASAIPLDLNEHSIVMAIDSTMVQLLRDGASIGSTVANSAVSTIKDSTVLVNSSTNLDSMLIDNYAICKGRNITCSGLPTGYKLRVGYGDSIIPAGKVATESGGTATVDCGGLTFPQSLVEILDGSNNVVKSLTLTNDVWGGDTFTYA